jgi:hypothetical protein
VLDLLIRPLKAVLTGSEFQEGGDRDDTWEYGNADPFHVGRSALYPDQPRPKVQRLK